MAANGRVQREFINRRRGIGIRTLVNGAWEVRSTTNLTKKGIRQAAEIAFKMAKASGKHVPTPVELTLTRAHKVSYKTKVKTDLLLSTIGELSSGLVSMLFVLVFRSSILRRRVFL